MTPEGFHIERVKIEAPARRKWLRATAALALAALASLPILRAIAQDQRAKLAADDAYWSLSGQSCQPLAADRFNAISTPPTSTAYDGTIYRRRGGAMTCTHRIDTIGGKPVRYPICKFSAPDYLAVVVNGRETFYDLTMGRAASVGVVDGQVRCTAAAKFEM